MSDSESENFANPHGSSLCRLQMVKAHKNDRILSLYGNSVVFVTESTLCGYKIQPPPAPPYKQQCGCFSLKHNDIPCLEPPFSQS